MSASCSSNVLLKITISSIHSRMWSFGRPDNDISIVRRYDVPALQWPNGVTLNSYLPRETEKAVFAVSSGKGIDQCAQAASNVVQNRTPFILYITS